MTKCSLPLAKIVAICCLLQAAACATTVNLTAIRSLFCLDSQIGFWTLSSQFGLRDANHTHPVDGSFNGTAFSYSQGPGDGSSSVITTSASTYPTFRGSKIDVTSGATRAQSFTIATWVRFYEYNYGPMFPIFEFNTGTTTSGLYLSSGPQQRDLSGNAMTNGVYSSRHKYYLICDTNDDEWKFVAVVYDAIEDYTRVFCNGLIGMGMETLGTVPKTTPLLALAAREQQSKASVASFACLSIYSTAVGHEEMPQLAAICQEYLKLKCPSNCWPDTCRVNLTAADGVSCTPCQMGLNCPEDFTTTSPTSTTTTSTSTSTTSTTSTSSRPVTTTTTTKATTTTTTHLTTKSSDSPATSSSSLKTTSASSTKTASATNSAAAIALPITSSTTTAKIAATRNDQTSLTTSAYNQQISKMKSGFETMHQVDLSLLFALAFVAAAMNTGL